MIAIQGYQRVMPDLVEDFYEFLAIKGFTD